MEVGREWRVLIWLPKLDQEKLQEGDLIVWLGVALEQYWAWLGVSVSC